MTGRSHGENTDMNRRTIARMPAAPPHWPSVSPPSPPSRWG